MAGLTCVDTKEGGLNLVAHPIGGVGEQTAHAGHLVAQTLLGEDRR